MKLLSVYYKSSLEYEKYYHDILEEQSTQSRRAITKRFSDSTYPALISRIMVLYGAL